MSSREFVNLSSVIKLALLSVSFAAIVFDLRQVQAVSSSSFLTPFSSSQTSVSSITAAVACSSLPSNNVALCYAQRANCHYSLMLNQCVSPAAQACGDYLSDSVGCTANSTCYYIPSASLCVAKPVMCASITTQSRCGIRSDCRWISGGCFNNTTTCGSMNTQVQCSANYCFWDIYLSSCFNTLAEIASNNPCSTWTSLSPTACVYHGCMMDITNTNCIPMYATAVSGNSISLISSVRYSNAQVLPGTTKFQVTASYPYALANNPPVWTFLTIGYAASSNLWNSPIPASSYCNNIANANANSNANAFGVPPITPPVVISGLNMTLEQQVFNTWVSTKSNMNFAGVPKTDPNYAAIFNLTSLVGFVNIDPTGTTSLATSVSLDQATASLDTTLVMDLTTISSQCSSFGAYQVQTLTGTYYTIPLVSYQYSGQAVTTHTLVTSTPLVYSVYVPSTGSIAVSAISGYTSNLYLIEVGQNTANCPAGQTSLLLTYELVIGNVYTAGSNYVGPMSASDIQFNSSQAPNVLYNCYGDYVYSFATGSSVSSLSISKSTFVISTLCRVLQPTPDTFTNCNYANYADRVQAMNGNYPFPAIDTQHTFFVTLWQTPLVASMPSTDTTKWVQVSTTAAPLQFPVTINVKSSISNPISVQLQVYAGLLPTPTTMLLSNATIVSYINSSGTISTPSSIPNYTSTMSTAGAFTFVIGMVSPQLQSLATLQISIDNSFAFIALDQNGAVIGTTMYWANVYPLMTYVPKQAIALGFCSMPTCPLLPASSSGVGFDGFSIPIAKLLSLAPKAAGFAFTTNYAFTLAGQVSQNVLHSTGFSLSSHSNSKMLNNKGVAKIHTHGVNQAMAFPDSDSGYTGVIGTAIRISTMALADTPATDPATRSAASTEPTKSVAFIVSTSVIGSGLLIGIAAMMVYKRCRPKLRAAIASKPPLKNAPPATPIKLNPPTQILSRT